MKPDSREKFVLRKSSAFSCYRTVFLGQAPSDAILRQPDDAHPIDAIGAAVGSGLLQRIRTRTARIPRRVGFVSTDVGGSRRQGGRNTWRARTIRRRRDLARR